MATVALVGWALLLGLVHSEAQAAISVERSVSVRESLSSRSELIGTIRYEVPSTWKTASRSSTTVSWFTVAATPRCTAQVAVSGRAALTGRTTAQQVASALPPGHRVALIRRGKRAHGSWGIDEIQQTEAVPPDRALYAIAPVHIRASTYLQIRSSAQFVGDCNDGVVRSGAVTEALENISRTATTHVQQRST